MSYNLGNTSKQRRDTCHPDIVLIINEAIKVSPIDWGVAQGSRTVEQQQQYFDEGKSKINPRAYNSLSELLKRAKHIVDGDIRELSEAFDVYAYVNGKADWKSHNLCLVAGVILSTAERLFAEGKISHKLRWGGNWDQDGEIITDQTFKDLPHFEIVKP